MASDQEQIDKTQAGRIAKWDDDVVSTIMGTPQGRYWMERLLEHCNMFSDVYQHDGDALGMAWRDGKANVGRHLLMMIDRACPDSYQRMIRERRERLEIAESKAKEAKRAEERMHSGQTLIESLADEQIRQEMIRRQERYNERRK